MTFAGALLAAAVPPAVPPTIRGATPPSDDWQRMLRHADQARWFLGASAILPAQPTASMAGIFAGRVQGAGHAAPVLALTAAGVTSVPIRPPGGEQNLQATGASMQGLPGIAQGQFSTSMSGGATLTTQLVRQRAPEPITDKQLSPTAVRPPRPAPAPVRIHVEPTERGLAVWLGIDGSADIVAARTAALLEALRRQAAQSGGRLSMLTCNGTIAYAAAAALNPKEKT